MLAELHHLLRGSLQVLAQPTLLLAELRRTVPDSRRRAREARLTEQFSTDPLPGLGRQQLHMDRSWHGLVPDQATPSRRLLLLHVPKTGGTSLRLMLQDHVPAERRFLSTGDYQWADTSIRQRSRYELFVGHNFLEPLYLLPEEDWVTALLVREPMAPVRPGRRRRGRPSAAQPVAVERRVGVPAESACPPRPLTPEGACARLCPCTLPRPPR